MLHTMLHSTRRVLSPKQYEHFVMRYRRDSLSLTKSKKEASLRTLQILHSAFFLSKRPSLHEMLPKETLQPRLRRAR